MAWFGGGGGFGNMMGGLGDRLRAGGQGMAAGNPYTQGTGGAYGRGSGGGYMGGGGGYGGGGTGGYGGQLPALFAGLAERGYGMPMAGRGGGFQQAPGNIMPMPIQRPGQPSPGTIPGYQPPVDGGPRGGGGVNVPFSRRYEQY
jgi:hypothetical protein